MCAISCWRWSICWVTVVGNATLWRFIVQVTTLWRFIV
jgi:hypothetical protein